jgi:hypothetical protein
LEYWDQCGLIDPYRLLLAIFAIGKDELQLPWSKNDIRAVIVVDDEIDNYGINKVIRVHMSDNKVIMTYKNLVTAMYCLLRSKYTWIEYSIYPPLECVTCCCITPCNCKSLKSV